MVLLVSSSPALSVRIRSTCALNAALVTSSAGGPGRNCEPLASPNGTTVPQCGVVYFCTFPLTRSGCQRRGSFSVSGVLTGTYPLVSWYPLSWLAPSACRKSRTAFAATLPLPFFASANGTCPTSAVPPAAAEASPNPPRRTVRLLSRLSFNVSPSRRCCPRGDDPLTESDPSPPATLRQETGAHNDRSVT